MVAYAILVGARGDNVNVTILDGARLTDASFSAYVTDLERCLRTAGHAVERLPLRDLNIRQCLGCWGCWVKTPGECVLKDDGERICRSVLSSDVTLFAAPLVMGFPTALLKRAVDRLIPLIHPYLAVVRGEIHHRKRYRRYPALALLVQRGDGDTSEDLDVVEQVFRRTALNFKSRLLFAHDTTTSIEEVADALRT